MTNLLFIVMDACRYDTFAEANTPNFDKVGKTLKVYSPSMSTIGTFLTYMSGGPPLNLPDDIIDSGYWLNYRPPNSLRQKKREGITTLYTALRNIAEIAKYFEDKFDSIEYTQFVRRGTLISLSCEKIFNKFIEDTKNEEQFHSVMWLMETHHPYSTNQMLPFNHIMKSNIWKNNQTKAIEYIDSQFGKVYDYLKSRNDDTMVIIIADHGDMMGEISNGRQRWHHSIYNKDLRVDYHDKLFEVPYIEGIV